MWPSRRKACPTCLNLWVAMQPFIGKHTGVERSIATMTISAVLVGGAGLVLTSCSLFDQKKKKPGNDPYGLKAYQQAGGRLAGLGAEATVQGASGGEWISGNEARVAGITPDEDIVWAPENPDEAIGGGLEELWQRPENKSWHQSYREASQQSKQTGNPMLIWFTDSRFSPICRRLSEELFSTPVFESWASGNLVRLRADSSVPERESNTALGIRKVDYVKKLKKRYGVHGHPTVLILSPGGEVQARYRGYKPGDHDYYWARMKQAVIKAQKAYGAWREKYESRGYRLWTSRDGRKTFAKLYRFRPGSVTLIDPDGKRGTTSFKRLCDADQAWILLQKKKYDASKGR
jgi:thioredoxin-related protein